MRQLYFGVAALVFAAIGLGAVTAGAQPPRRGLYRIENVKSGLCLSIEGSSMEQNARLIQDACQGTENQEFRVAVEPNGSDIYTLIAGHSSQCLQARGGGIAPMTEIVQSRCTNQDPQKFQLISEDPDSYLIQSQRSDLCFAVREASLENGAPIVQFPCHGRPNEQFRFVRLP